MTTPDPALMAHRQEVGAAFERRLTNAQIVERSLKRVREQIDVHFAKAKAARKEPPNVR